jgi:hypothetical protein
VWGPLPTLTQHQDVSKACYNGRVAAEQTATACKQVIQIVVSLCMELADLITDGVTCYRLIRGDVTGSNETYEAVYIALLCFGAATTVVSIAYRLRNASLMHRNLHKLSTQPQPVGAVSSSLVRQQSQQHEWELTQTHRTKVTAALTIMSIVVQGVCAIVAASVHLGFEATAARSRFADVRRELLPDLRRRQHRQDGASRKLSLPAAYVLIPC